jgi:hypothetical protein
LLEVRNGPLAPIYVGTLYWNRSKWIKLEDTSKRVRKERDKDELQGAVGDGKSCTKSHLLRVRRDVAEQIILRPVVDELLAPDVISEVVVEMRRYYAEKTAAAKADKAKLPAEVAELDQRIARLRGRLKAGDPDMAADDIMAVIEKVEARKAELTASQPEAKHQAKLLRALPAAAKQYRDEITKGLPREYNGGGKAAIGGADCALNQRLTAATW